MIFRLTINGGLEDLSQRELEHIFPHQTRLHWNRKGDSGSQLELETSTTTTTDDDNDVQQTETLDVCSLIQRLHYVDYIYCQVYCHQFSLQQPHARLEVSESQEESATNREGYLLHEIRDKILLHLDQEQLAKVTMICRQIQEMYQPRGVGLESLPGQLLPTPKIVNSDELDDMSTPSTTSFQVNTIYTKNPIAKSVVDIFVRLVLQAESERRSDVGMTGSRRILWLDAGAGSGSLWRHLPEMCRLGVDLQPTRPEIIQTNFLSATSSWIKKQHDGNFDVLAMISNPPFADGTRGDYSAIVQFINHASQTLNAQYVGLIVPTTFVRRRIWDSLGMDRNLKLCARFLMPQDSFFDPSTSKSVHIHSNFLFFERCCDPVSDDVSPVVPRINNSYYLQGKRNKGDFPEIQTAHFIQALAQGLSSTSILNGIPEVMLVSQSQAECTMMASLQRNKETAEVKLFLLLNPEQPLALANSQSCHVREHSLGWMSTSVKPPVARALLESSTLSNDPSGDNCGTFLVNLMAGEGTIELESQDFVTNDRPIFILSGDKSMSALRKNRHRLDMYRKVTGKRTLVDMVLWDAQNLPIRRDVVDIFLADLPFTGGQSKKHQAPTCHSGGNNGKSSDEAMVEPLSYRSIMIQAIQALRPGGCAALLSADTRALAHATRTLHWQSSTTRGISRISLGGLNGQLLVFNKCRPCYKDVSMWMFEDNAPDLSAELLLRVRDSISTFALNDMLELIVHPHSNERADTFLVDNVTLVDTYFHPTTGKLSHNYRITLDNRLTNVQAKQLEKVFRQSLVDTLLPGVLSLR